MVSQDDILIEKKLEDGTIKKFILRRFQEKDAHRIFMAWNNPQSYRYNSIDWNERSVKYMVNRPWPSVFGLYFMVLEDIDTKEILATCRFGRYYNSKPEDKVWDFGYSTFRSDDKENYTVQDIREVFQNGVKPDKMCWGKGYASLMVEEIIKIAKQEGIVKLISGADGANLASQKVIMKNGLKFYQIDSDGDVDFALPLIDENGASIPYTKPTKEELQPIWENHVEMIKKQRKKLLMRLAIKKNDKRHYGDSLFYLLMTKASNLEDLLQVTPPDKQEIVKQQNDIISTYNQLTKEEKKLVNKRLKAYNKRWQKRIGNEQFEQSEVEFNLRCCDCVESYISSTILAELQQ